MTVTIADIQREQTEHAKTRRERDALSLRLRDSEGRLRILDMTVAALEKDLQKHKDVLKDFYELRDAAAKAEALASKQIKTLQSKLRTATRARTKTIRQEVYVPDLALVTEAELRRALKNVT